MNKNEYRIERFKEMMKPCFCRMATGEAFPITQLIEAGYFTCPASLHHHGKFEGALFDHSVAVTESLLYLTEKLELKWKTSESPLIIGMFHDLCKVDNYKKTVHPMTLENPDFKESWAYNNAPLLTGHGEKSVIMLQQLGIRLTEEEILCIRWHMGAFDKEENWNSYGRSVTRYPNVLYTHTADMIAARVLGV